MASMGRSSALSGLTDGTELGGSVDVLEGGRALWARCSGTWFSSGLVFDGWLDFII